MTTRRPRSTPDDPRYGIPLSSSNIMALSSDSAVKNYGDLDGNDPFKFRRHGHTAVPRADLMRLGFNPYSHVAYPGHPGYLGQGDTPTGTPKEPMTVSSKGLPWAAMRDAGNGLTVNQALNQAMFYGENDVKAWIDVIGERAFSSPRFYEAMRKVDSQDPGSFDRLRRSLDNPSEPAAEGQTHVQRWHELNAQSAGMYWKAHQSVSMGEFDHIEDPFEDRARNAPRPQRRDPKEARRWRPITRRDGSTLIGPS